MEESGENAKTPIFNKLIYLFFFEKSLTVLVLIVYTEFEQTYDIWVFLCFYYSSFIFLCVGGKICLKQYLKFKIEFGKK